MSKKGLAIILILGVALFSRAIDLGKNPAGVNHDEASQGYNSFSLLTTGKDEYGKSWPVMIRSFGTYASSLYTYMTILPVEIMGLNAVSVRVTSFIAGIILVVITILALGPTTGLVVAISPVFIFLSRAAFEANLALTILMLGLVLTVRSGVKSGRLPISFLLISLSAYAYHVERVLSLILLFYISVYYWQKKFNKTVIILSLSLAILLQTPLLLISLTPGANSRVSALTYSDNLAKKIVDYGFLFLSYFSPNNLFSRPDPGPNKAFPELSSFYWWMIIPFIYGVRKIIRDQEYRPFFGKLLIALLVLSPAISAATRDYFSTWRALPMFVTYAWIISRGLESMIKKKTLIYGLLVLAAMIEVYSNLVLQKHERSVSWGYPYQSLAQFVRNNPQEPIVIDSASHVYIWLAFYNSYSPQRLQQQVSPDWLKNYYYHTQYEPINNIENVSIRPIFWKEDVYKNQILISDSIGISQSQAKEHFLTPIAVIPDINGSSVFTVYRTDPTTKRQSSGNTRQ